MPKSMPGKKPSVQQLQDKVDELTSALQHERADALNVRRRAEQDKEKMASFYKVIILRELLPAIDNLERALKHTPKELANNDYVKGVQSVAKEFDNSLSRLGIEKIKSVGEMFDPHLHDAIGVEGGSSNSLSSEEVVCEELQAGYTLEDEVIRPALVKVKKS